MSRWKAASIHLAASATLALLAFSLLFFVWFPPPLFGVSGGDRLVLLLISIDLVIGPLLTLIVFRPGKRGLRFDLTVIAVLQVAALAYGLHVITAARPAWIVFAVDRFVAVSASSLEDADREAAQPRFRALSWTGPRLVGAKPPTDEKESLKVLGLALAGKDIDRLPHYYVDYDEVREQVAGHRQPLARLAKKNADAVAAFVRAHGGNESAFGYVPLVARNRDIAAVVDASGDVVGYIDADPW